MGDFLIYIIKSTCCLSLFYICYKTFLSNETFFRFNRRIILLGILFGILAPFIKIQTKSTGVLQEKFREIEYIFIPQEDVTQNITVLSVGDRPESSKKLQLSDIYFIIYLTGGFITLAFFIHSTSQLGRLIRNGKKIKTKEATLVLIRENISPFNWWNIVVLSEADYNNNPKEILIHEYAHCRLKHSIDLIFMEFIILLHWFNPVIWLIKRELQDIHEYEADHEVLKQGIDATKYQLLLVKKAVGSSSYTFANSFNQSKLKKRITMMCKQQSNKRNRWKVVLLLPVMAGTLYAFATPAINRQSEQFVQHEDSIISSATEKFNNGDYKKQFDNWAGNNVQNASLFSFVNSLTNEYDLARILVNSLDEVLFNGKYIKADDLSALLSNAINQTSGKKPIIVYLKSDIGSSSGSVDQLKEIAEKTLKENRDKIKEKGFEVLFLADIPEK